MAPVGTLAYRAPKAYYVGKRTLPQDRRNMQTGLPVACGAFSYAAFDRIAVGSLPARPGSPDPAGIPPGLARYLRVAPTGA